LIAAQYKASYTNLTDGTSIKTKRGIQTARQNRFETPQEFADRCRALAQKTVTHADDPGLQKFQYDQAQRMLLAAFTSGLAGNPGQQVRFRLPKTMKHCK
jgi:hypothetical protein